MLQRNERVTVRISGPTSFRSMAGKIVFEKVTRRVISGSCPRPWSRRLGGKARPGAEPASKQNPESGSLGLAALWAAERLSQRCRLIHGPARPGTAQPGEDARPPPRSSCLRNLGPLHLTFPAGHKAFCRCRSGWRPREDPHHFLYPSFPSSFFSYFGVSRWSFRSALEGAGSVATDWPPLGAERPAASEAGAASVVSMVTAPPASPPRGEDAACRSRRLAPGLTAGPGPLRRKVPAAGLRGRGHQVRAGLGGAERGVQVDSATSPSLHPWTHSRKRPLRGFSGRRCARGVLVCFCFCFFPGKQPEKETAAHGEADRSGFSVLPELGEYLSATGFTDWFSFIFSEIPFSGWRHRWPQMREMLYRGTKRR